MSRLLADSVVQNTADGSNTLFEQVSSLTTGLSAASTIANIYLAYGYDDYAWQELQPSFLARYIDDGLGILDIQGRSEQDIRKTLNGWHASLHVPAKDFCLGDRVHFLNLNITLSSTRSVNFSTFRKPQTTCDYIPTNSADSASTFRGTVAGECNRLLVTISTASSYAFQLDFFRRKLARRGYNHDLINRAFSKYPFSRRLGILHPVARPAAEKTKVFGHGVHFFPGIHRLRWKSGLSRIRNSLAKHVGKCKVRTFYRICPNIFLRLYTASWRP